MQRQMNDNVAFHVGDDGANCSSSPPPPPPRRRARYFPLELLPAVMAFCDMVTVVRSSLVCKHWHDECSSPRVWYLLAVGTEQPPSPHPATRTLTLEELKRAAALRHQLMHRRNASHVTGGDQRSFGQRSDLRETREVVGSQRGVDPEPHEKFSTSIGRFDAKRNADTRAAQWRPQQVTVRAAIDHAASSYVADGSRVRMDSTTANREAALPLEVLERIRQVLTDRASRAAVAATDMARTFEGKVAALNTTIRTYVEKQVQEVHDQVADVSSFREQADGAIQRAAIQRATTEAARVVLTKMKRFEAIVVRTVLHHHSSLDSSSSPASAAPRPPAITDFAALELFLLSKPRYGSPMWVQWTQVKRCIPVDDAYYDLKDLAADADDPAIIGIREFCRSSGVETADRRNPKYAVWCRIGAFLAGYEERRGGGEKLAWNAAEMLKLLNSAPS